MWEYNYSASSDELYHYGVKGQKWGVRRYQNADGSLKKGAKGRYGEKPSNMGKKSSGAKRIRTEIKDSYYRQKANNYMRKQAEAEITKELASQNIRQYSKGESAVAKFLTKTNTKSYDKAIGDIKKYANLGTEAYNKLSPHTTKLTFERRSTIYGDIDLPILKRMSTQERVNNKRIAEENKVIKQKIDNDKNYKKDVSKINTKYDKLEKQAKSVDERDMIRFDRDIDLNDTYYKYYDRYADY